jgi:short subunit dehydrogenase-like uncharacterized protein
VFCVVETAFGQLAIDRHLTTSKTFTHSAAGARTLSLMATSTGFTQSTTLTTTEALSAVLGTRLGF